MSQFQSFAMAVERVNKNELLNQLAVQTVAARGDEKSLKAMQRDLDPDHKVKTGNLGIPEKFITK